MSLAHDAMMTPPIEELLDRVPSKFGLVTLAARRGRNINSYFGHLGEGLGQAIPPQVSSISRKPLSISFEEIAAGKIVWAEPVEELLEEAAALEILGGLEGGLEAGLEAGADGGHTDDTA